MIEPKTNKRHGAWSTTLILWLKISLINQMHADMNNDLQP